jgi:predicted 3-demethylubiquinone-9 3-methyltransferase (glyoxalase superfamily)
MKIATFLMFAGQGEEALRFYVQDKWGVSWQFNLP